MNENQKPCPYCGCEKMTAINEGVIKLLRCSKCWSNLQELEADEEDFIDGDYQGDFDNGE